MRAFDVSHGHKSGKFRQISKILSNSLKHVKFHESHNDISDGCLAMGEETTENLFSGSFTCFQATNTYIITSLVLLSCSSVEILPKTWQYNIFETYHDG